MRRIIKMIRMYFTSKDMWGAKMEDPILPRRPSPVEMEKLKREGVILIEEENWVVAKDIATDITSQGKSVEEALANLKEALELFYEDEPLRIQKPFFTASKRQ